MSSLTARPMPTSRSPFFLRRIISIDCAFQAIVAATAINWSDLSYYSLFYHILSYVLHEAIVAIRTYIYTCGGGVVVPLSTVDL